jgi:glycosyltransferase involved in cell wall biosynthesis
MKMAPLQKHGTAQQELRILLFIGKLSTGGAERQFVELAKGLHQRGVPVAVMLNKSGGEFYSELMQFKIPIYILDLGTLAGLPGYYRRGYRVIKDFRPSILYGFMGAGIKATFMTLFNQKLKTIWGIRNALVEQDYSGSLEMRIASVLDRWFSSLATALICNSRSGADALVLRGFDRNQIRVVNNGTDTYKFSFDTSARQHFRNNWRAPESRVLIGLVGRLHPVKNHKVFIQMAKRLISEGKDIGFVCIGSGDSYYAKELLLYAEMQGVAGCFIWTGHQAEVAPLYSALDLLVSSSDTEAFPNVILEAMSIGLPVIATDVGDCSSIVADRGWIVPVNNSFAMANAVNSAIESLSEWDGLLSRQRVIEHFSLDAMVDNTMAVFKDSLNKD